MSLRTWVRSLFGSEVQASQQVAIKLDVQTEATLLASLSKLTPGQRGWINFAEANRLFELGSEDPNMWTTEGMTAISEFAVRNGCTTDTRASEKRIYFTRT